MRKRLAALTPCLFCLFTTNQLVAQNIFFSSAPKLIDPAIVHDFDKSAVRFVDDQGNYLQNVKVVDRRGMRPEKFLNQMIPYAERQTFRSDESGIVQIVNFEKTRPQSWVAFKAGFAPTTILSNGIPQGVVLTRGQSFKGTIVDENGDPISGAEVWLCYFSRNNRYWLSLFGSSVHISTTTDQHGKFQIDNLPRTPVVGLSVEKHGFVSFSFQISNGDDSIAASGVQRVENGATLELDRATQIQIEYVAEDTGEQLATCDEKWRPSSLQSGRFDIQNHESGLPPLRLFAGPGQKFRIYAVAQPDKHYVGRWKDVVFPASEKSPLKLTESLTRGTIVRGRVVDDESNRPIKGVWFLYFASDRKNFSANRWYVPYQKSDEHGRFQFVAPPVQGFLKLSSNEVDGYKVASDSDYRLTTEQSARFRKNIDASTKPDEIEIEFRLKKAPPIVGTVKSEGMAIPHARYAVIDQESRTSSDARIGVTDKSGRFEIDGIYNQTGIHVDSETGFDPPADPRHKAAADPRTKILFWDQDGLNTTVVYVPTTPGDQAAVEIDVNLNQSCVVVGRMVDNQTGRPVPGVRIQPVVLAGNGESFYRRINKLLPESLTDRNGNFRCIGIPGNIAVDLGFQKSDVIFNRFPAFKLSESGKELDFGTILCDVMPDLSKVKLALPSMQDMDDEARLQALSKSIDDYLNRIPRVPGGTSQSKTVLQFRSRVSTKFVPELLRIAKANTGTELEFKVLTTTFQKFYFKLSPLWRDEPWMPPARKALIDSHLNHPDLGEKMFRYLNDDVKLLTEVLENADSKEIQAIACIRLLRSKGNQLVPIANKTPFEKRQFTELWEETRKLMTKSLSPDFKKINESGRGRIHSQAKSYLINQLSSSLRNCRHRDEQAVQSAQKAIQDAMRTPSKPRKPF